MSRDEARRFHWTLTLNVLLLVALTFFLSGSSEFSAAILFSWSFVGLMSFVVTVLVATLYGYYRRDEIDIGDEVAMNPNGMYWGAAAGALAPVIVRWIEDLFF